MYQYNAKPIGHVLSGMGVQLEVSVAAGHTRGIACSLPLIVDSFIRIGSIINDTNTRIDEIAARAGCLVQLIVANDV